MTTTKILDSLSEKMAQQYRLHGLYEHIGKPADSARALERVQSIYWDGLDLLGDHYMGQLSEIKDNARRAAEASVKLVKAYINQHQPKGAK